MLAAHGADPNAASAQNFTPLGIASQYGKDEAAVALIEAGADPNRPIGEAGYTPLMLATANHSHRRRTGAHCTRAPTSTPATAAA